MLKDCSTIQLDSLWWTGVSKQWKNSQGQGTKGGCEDEEKAAARAMKIKKVNVEVKEKWPELSNHARGCLFFLKINLKGGWQNIWYKWYSRIGPGQPVKKLTLEPRKWPWHFDGLKGNRGKHRNVTIIYCSCYLDIPKWWLSWGIPLMLIY